ncbi:MAG: stage III sporulation protein AD [Blautia sp.]|nr:stage III sporulation protein AD [Blautia sp.]MDY4516401.1 SpoIIIAC/SpoIIIAD family protein [Lachnospiraceae bacterium]
MLKIAMLGIAGILTALFLKEVRPTFTVYISMATCLLIFFYSISRLSFLAETLVSLKNYIDLKDSYLTALMKVAGITYIADFSASLCKDAGYSAIAGQIEFFGKISILAVSTPVILALLDTISGFLV